jgi:inner membrane protein involved in colicin E2 resistance
MSVIGAALISFFAMSILSLYFSRNAFQRIAGYSMFIDLPMHVGLIYLFLNTSALGLLQAELSAVMITMSLFFYRKLFGYQRLERKGLRLKWKLYHGRLR